MLTVVREVMLCDPYHTTDGAKVDLEAVVSAIDPLNRRANIELTTQPEYPYWCCELASSNGRNAIVMKYACGTLKLYVSFQSSKVASLLWKRFCDISSALDASVCSV